MDATADVKKDIGDRLREQLGLDTNENVDFADFALVLSDCPVNEPHKYLAGELAEMQLNSDLKLSGSGRPSLNPRLKMNPTASTKMTINICTTS